MVTNLDLGIGYAHYLSDGVINNKQDFSLPCSRLGANFNIGLEYKIKAHLGFKIQIQANTISRICTRKKPLQMLSTNVLS